MEQIVCFASIVKCLLISSIICALYYKSGQRTMSLKQQLGLGTFPINDGEILRQLEEARLNRREVIEFVCGQRRVTVRVSQIAPEGIMREYEAYYAR